MKILTKTDILNENIGNKAKNLLILKENGFNICENNFILDCNELNDINFINNINLECFDNNKLYAVRSSAIGEDGHKNSFAGIFRSILNVEKKDILSAIKDVNESFYSRKAKVYSDIKKTTYKPCILIQEMVQSDYSIVMFVAENKVELNFAVGLCEQIVSGECKTLELVCDLNDENFNENVIKLDKEFNERYNDLNIKEIFFNIEKIKKINGDFLDIEMTYNASEKKWYYLQVRTLIH